MISQYHFQKYKVVDITLWIMGEDADNYPIE